MTCGGSFPPFRFAPSPVASTASSTASRGTQDASTPREIQSLSRPSATLPVCVIARDHAGQQAKHPATTRQTNQDQLKLSGIESSGGKVRELVWTVGQYDMVCVAD